MSPYDQISRCLTDTVNIAETAPSAVVPIGRLRRRGRRVADPHPAVGDIDGAPGVELGSQPVAGEDHEDAAGRVDDVRPAQPAESRHPRPLLRRRHRRRHLPAFARTARRAGSVDFGVLLQFRRELLPVQSVRG